MKMIHSFSKISCTLLACAVLFTACDKKDPWAGEFKGDEAAFGAGKAYTYVVNNDDGNPIEIGVAISGEAFAGLTELSGDVEVSLNYPEEAGKTPFKHQFMGFAAHGHPPVGVYDVAHFDCHFYTSTIDERSAIGPFDTIQGARLPAAGYFPEAYFPTDLVPNMGIHWLDGTAPELAGAGFTETFIWGSFDNKVTFLEPMITKAFMETTHDFEEALKLPATYDQAGKYYPSRQGFSHNHETGEYRIYLSGFVRR